jgi:pimeloyl-ACP methyl ester carboxylesterase
MSAVEPTPAVLLLPGMMLSAPMYMHQVRALAKDHAVSVGDISRSSSIAATARSLLEKAPPRFALVGLSMGGIVALEMWRQAPERISHLGLLDTTPYADHPDRQQLRLEQMAQVEAGQLQQVLTHSMKPLYLASKNRSDIALLSSVLRMGMDLGPEVFRRQSVALRERRDSTGMLRTIGCPTLVMCGREDQLCPPEWHEAMARSIPKADLVVLAECGHLSAMEEPQAVTHALQHLLGRTQ